MDLMNNQFVSSEIGRLEKVIMHSPDEGIELVTPDKAMEYLYDDIVFLKKMKQEHLIFSKVVRSFVGKKNLYDIQELLVEVLKNQKVKNDLVDAICRFEECENEAVILQNLSPKNLAFTLITGKIKEDERIVFPPISNLIFCRDIGVVINDHLLVCEAAMRARARESILGRYIFRHSDILKNYKIVEISSFNIFLESFTNTKKNISIEGGDVMMIHKDHLLIGISERTTMSGIKILIQILFHHKVVKTITTVAIPKQRYCMHLDTIFTMIDDNVCVAFEPLITKENILEVVQYSENIENKKSYKSLKEMLQSIWPKLQFIPCGGGVTPHAEREQWTDGCNLFTLKPGVAVTYDRNYHTAKALEKFGYQLIPARKFLEGIKSGNLNSIEKTIILIPSNELSRARGGTHCLTFPISRVL